ncbi:glycosyltransferase [Microbacterium esteraromaticum]|uniref:Glycosyltransferase n=1 Tax=Microbacterium esteraromaticum TaxID=57043 RepID=A0A7D7WFI0_9MICO|nr:glycosyltransferase [Microbacterium esteraromaticum]QMU97739.1 glycosyltransferase [Microbacterium esteraromaticum]
MPSRVHAIVVARTGDSAAAQLGRTLEAISRQSTPPDAITVVVLGSGAQVRAVDGIGRSVEAIVEARATTTFAEAVQLAQPRIADGSSVWMLTQDSVPEPGALQLLAGSLERSPSAALAAPKLVRHDDDREIVSMGVSMSRFGRTVQLAADELDQGQHDAVEDALGADVRGMLIRGAAPVVLRPDTGLGGADEGLDLGVRARLGGGRAVLVPKARIGVRPDGVAAAPQRDAARAWVSRRAQLHRRLAYAPAFVVPLHWLTLLPLALWRSIVHLIAKRPGAVAPEWGAALASMVSIGAIARSRRAISSFRTASWSSIAPLRISRTQLRHRLDDGHGTERGAVSELRFFSGGGAWAVLAALAVGIAAFFPLLAWPSIGGGELLPMRQEVADLWADAAWGMRELGLGVVGPADPFAAVLAVLGTLWPGAPSFAVVLLWLGALPLAVLGGWFAATRVTERAGLRILGGVLWALAPTFLAALVQGRPAAVLLHLLLPWLFHSAAVAHRSWGAAGAASLLAAASLACAPSLAPALATLWALTLILMLSTGRLRGAVRVFWLLVPAAAMFAPLVFAQVHRGSPWALLADPGAVEPLAQATADAIGRLSIAQGFPAPDQGGWDWLLGGFAPLAAVLLAPVAVLALVSALSPRWRAGFALLITTMTGLITAMLAVGVAVSFADGEAVAIWPGTGISLAWLGASGAALVTLDTVVARPALRSVTALVTGAGVLACALPGLLAVNVGEAQIRNGATSTLPALVAAHAADDIDSGTLVMTPLDDGSLGTQLVWGPSATLGAQTTLLSTATSMQGDDLATDAVDLLSARDFDAAAALADRGIGFVLLSSTPGQSDRARSMVDAAITAIDQRAGFVKAGETPNGMLWQIDAPIAARAEPSDAQHTVGRLIGLAQIVVVLAALLLAIPTRASRREARARSRVVGRSSDEPIVPARRGVEHGDATTGPVQSVSPPAQPEEESR